MSHTTHRLALGLAVTTAVLATASPARAVDPVTTTYAFDDSFAANPERGFYRHQHDCETDDFTAAELRDYSTQGYRLVMCLFQLPKDTDVLPEAVLDQFTGQALAARAHGLKLIVRFSYGDTSADAPFERVMLHIDQLAPLLQRHSGVIAVVQSGFVGAWGEGAASEHFGTESSTGRHTAEHTRRRNAVITRLIEVLPQSRTVQVRTHRMKRTVTATDTHATVFDVRRAVPPLTARIGHHNDCFLSAVSGDTTEQGTYLRSWTSPNTGAVEDVNAQKAWLRRDTVHSSMGGETCTFPASVPCDGAKLAMDDLNYTFLNQDHNTDVVTSWNTAGCRSQIERSLGYRLSLQSVTLPSTVTRGVDTRLSLTMRNTGWARPMNPRRAVLVLRGATGDTFRFSTGMRVEAIAGGASWTTTDHAFRIPSTVPGGSYRLLLELPDADADLARLPAYSVRLASRLASGAPMHDPATGLHDLGRTVTVR